MTRGTAFTRFIGGLAETWKWELSFQPTYAFADEWKAWSDAGELAEARALSVYEVRRRRSRAA